MFRFDKFIRNATNVERSEGNQGGKPFLKSTNASASQNEQHEYMGARLYGPEILGNALIMRNLHCANVQHGFVALTWT